MAEKKSSTILLTVIGIATLLVTLVGATYAYFTASFQDKNEENTDVVIEAAELGTITFEHGSEISLVNVYPGTSDTVGFSILPDDAATVGVAYTVYMDVTANTFTTSNIKAALSGPAGETNNLTVGTAVDKTTGTVLDATTYGATKEVPIASGVINPGEVDAWNLTVGLVEADADQNADQSATFTARLRVEATAQYTQQSVYRSGN